MPPKKIVVLVSGRGSNLQALLDAERDGKITSTITAVISNRADAKALARAEAAGVKTVVVASRNRPAADFFKELYTTLKQHNPDLIVLAGFMKILPAEIVQVFQNRIINIHPSLLPAFPGLNAQQQALAAGATNTGCTVHFVDAGCDTGPIILQKRVPILANDTVDTLSARLIVQEHAALVEAIQLLENNKVVLQHH